MRYAAGLDDRPNFNRARSDSAVKSRTITNSGERVIKCNHLSILISAVNGGLWGPARLVLLQEPASIDPGLKLDAKRVKLFYGFRCSGADARVLKKGDYPSPQRP